MTLSVDSIVVNKMYIGTLKNKANPKTRDYWLGSQNGLIVLNPEITARQLDNAKLKVANARKENKTILVLCEKIVYRDELEKLANDANIYYMNYKVPGGVLTNFDTLLSRIHSMNELREYIESEDFDKLTKKEQLVKMRQLKKLEKVYKGVKGLKAKPDMIIVIDGMQMLKYVEEIEKVGLESIVFVNSDFNRRWTEDRLVMCNLNSYNAIDFAMKYILT